MLRAGLSSISGCSGNTREASWSLAFIHCHGKLHVSVGEGGMWRLRTTEFLDNPEFCALTPGSNPLFYPPVRFPQSSPPILLAQRGPQS